MLISKTVEVNLCSKNIPYYESLGYDIPKRRRSNKVSKNELTVPVGTKILVKISDLPKGSNILVNIKCDYCGKEFKKTYDKYIKQNENSIIKKDCCYNCVKFKNKETFIFKYGVEWNSQLDIVREKISDANKENEITVKKYFKNAGYIMLDSYKGYTSPIRFICTKHREYGEQVTSYCIVKNYNSGCHYCRYEKITGENCHLWKGGITDLSNYLRGKINDWKQYSFKSNNYKCLLTGISNETLIIHHLYSFGEIVKETLKNTKLELHPEVTMYTKDELKILEDECNKIHFKTGLGKPILNSLHLIFHANYGNLIIDNGEFEEFTKNYKNFEYDYLLEDSYKYSNIIKEQKE